MGAAMKQKRKKSGVVDVSPTKKISKKLDQDSQQKIPNNNTKPRPCDLLPHIFAPKPNMRTSPPNWGDDPSPEARKLVDLTLHRLNRRSDDINKYEFGGGLHINAFVDDGVWCHLNFVAKAKVYTDFNNCGPHLMFAELRRLPEQSEYEVLSCHNLGPAAALAYPKLFGCRACDIAPHRDVMTHACGRSKFNVGVASQYR